MRRWATVLAAGTVMLTAGAVVAPGASASPQTSYCFTDQGPNWGSASCQTTAPKNHWQLQLVCQNNAAPSIRITVQGQWHTGDGSDKLYCPNGYSAAYPNIKNDN
ncbi:hypothetical protein ACH4GP_12660 [Streptomyces celluloflavus]|uniref:Secreted protein n=1 Tax=Streptomyces celluloflavus TaxID=58344 RepID=A0ABW7RD09_9ACTN